MPFDRRALPALVLLLSFAGAPAAGADERFSSLEERLSFKEFTGYGLDRLTPEQLRGLNEWLRTHAGAGSAAATARPAADMPAVAAPAAHDSGGRITSRIAGAFTGWRHESVIALQNGQRWEVRDEEPLVASREEAPRVTVERGLLDGWTLTVDGHSEVAHVVPAKP